MKLRQFISNVINEVLNESVNTYGKLIKLAKSYDYDTFLSKTDGLSRDYDMLYRGMATGDVLEDGVFMTDYIGHARQYADGDNIDGIIINYSDVLKFTDDVFNDLRAKLTKLDIKKIYTGNRWVGGRSEMSFVYKFIQSKIPYTKIQQDFEKNNLLIPVMLYYAKMMGKNIIKFLGSDYSEYGGADEFVVNDISRYTKLSDIWKKANSK